MCDPRLTTRFISTRGSVKGLGTQEEDMGLHEYEVNARIAELQDIAALDRLAGEGQPSSVLNRWATREHRASRPGGLRRLLHLSH